MKIHPLAARRPRPQQQHHQQRGNVLIGVLLGIVLLTAFATVAFDYTSANARINARKLEMHAAYGVADGALEILYGRWRRAVLGSDLSTHLSVTQLTTGANPTTIDITRSTVNSSNLLNTVDDLGMAPETPYRIAKITLVRKDVYGRVQPDSQMADLIPSSTCVYLAAKPGATGFSSQNIVYEAKVWVTSTLHGSVDNNLNVTSGQPITIVSTRLFTKSITPKSQCAIDFENQLELFPGSNMTVDGKVHTNDNLYAGGVRGSVLNFLDDVNYSGYYNRDASGDRPCPTPTEHGMGSVTDADISHPEYNGGDAPGDQLQRVERMNIGGLDPSKLNGDNSGNAGPVNYNDDSYREIIERPVRLPGKDPATASTTLYSDYYGDPDPNSSNPNAAGDPGAIRQMRAYNQATLKILITKRSGGSGKMDVTVLGKTPTDAAGNLMADGPDLNTTGHSALVKAISDAINSSTNGQPTQMVDLREDPTGGAKVEIGRAHV